MNTNTCPCGYPIDELCTKCAECSLFPCSYFEGSVDVLEDDRAYDISYDYDDYDYYYYDYDDIDEIERENEQRDLHYGGVTFRDHWTLDE